MATPITDPAAFAETHFSITLKKKTSDEWSGPCPKCGGEDRFLVFADGGFWCRQCGYKGWLDALDGAKPPTQQELLEARIRRLEQKQREQERRLDALERMMHSQDHILYHKALEQTPRALDWWLGEGISVESVYKYQLGYCHRCPTDREGRASYTLPVINGGKLCNIRHRLTSAANGDKYRPHMAGLPATLFNMDAASSDGEIVIVEGEKKSIVLEQNGVPNTGIMGKRSFKRQWLDLFAQKSAVYIALDPDATESAFRLAGLFDRRGRVVQLPVKPDEFFYRYGGTLSDFRDFMKLSKAVA